MNHKTLQILGRMHPFQTSVTEVHFFTKKYGAKTWEGGTFGMGWGNRFFFCVYVGNGYVYDIFYSSFAGKWINPLSHVRRKLVLFYAYHEKILAFSTPSLLDLTMTWSLFLGSLIKLHILLKYYYITYKAGIYQNILDNLIKESCVPTLIYLHKDICNLQI